MNNFEQFLNDFAQKVLRGQLDLAVVEDKFIKGGLYEPEPIDLEEILKRD